MLLFFFGQVTSVLTILWSFFFSQKKLVSEMRFRRIEPHLCIVKA